ERRDHVRIAGGFGPPLAIRCSAFCRLRSIKGPFLSERGISLQWTVDSGQLTVFLLVTRHLSLVTFFSCPSRSCCPSACCGVSCNRVSAGPTALPDCGRLTSCPRHHHAGDRPGSSRRRGPWGA